MYATFASCALERLRRELHITYRIVWRDLSASLIPATLMSLAALHTTEAWSARGIVGTVGRCFLYFSLYIYTFCLSNQIVGYEEDRVNKPDRVLPSGMITLSGARRRWAVAMVAFPAVAWLLGGAAIARWAIGWQLIFLAYNHLGLDRHWLTKNVVFITLGTWVQLAAAWALAAPLTPVAWRYIWVISLAFGITLHLQDLRDVEGDRLMGRLTLPMALGQRPTRWLLAVGIGALPLVTHFGLATIKPLGVPSLSVEAALAALNLWVAIRTLRHRTPSADHRTYMLHTYWFCAVVAAGLVLL